MGKTKKNAISVIGGADGPTSIFIAGQTKRPLKYRIQNVIYKYRRRRAEKKICANAHTLKEVVRYMKTQYFAAEISETQKEYMDQRRYLRESLVLRYKPELLDGEPDLTKPDLCDNDSIQELYRQLQLRSERIEQIPDREMPMDFHIFEIKKEGGRMEIEIDYIWDVLGISYSGNKKEMRYLRKIARDIYLYYGVSEEDIRDRTERYQALVTALCG